MIKTKSTLNKWILTSAEFDNFTDSIIEVVKFLKGLYHNKENYAVRIPGCGEYPLKEVKFVASETNSVKMYLETRELLFGKPVTIQDVYIVQRGILPFRKSLKIAFPEATSLSPMDSFTFKYNLDLSYLREFILEMECRGCKGQ